ncbi:MAG: proprotein convertase P-domain-containing protein [Saprospiraceae bacterium]
MTKNIYTLIIAFFATLSVLPAQTYIMGTDTDITDCSGFILDSGGSSDAYSPNENLTTTICPDGAAGTHVQLVFSAVDIAGGDALCFFDGPDATAPPLSCAADFDAGNPFIVQATAVNPGGCITVVFTSDGTGEGNGYSADINCIAACQTILAELVSTDPPAMPADTGWIDICPGEGIFFEGTGVYPQDGAVYNHSNFTSSFSWNFGDGATSQGPTAFHVFEEPGGYIVQLSIEDQFGCTNTNFISQRVRVSTYPDFDLGPVPESICVGDTIELAAVVSQVDTNSTVSVTPNPGSFQTSGVLSDSLALPDGVGTCYETSILFSDFSPGQVLTDINDFLSICVVMEHSWMHDLDIFLSCPDGTQIILQDQVFEGFVNLGEPIDGDGLNPIPGLGYQYCWTPNATNGTWTEYYNDNNVTTLPEGDYNPFESFDNFLGCPLNGEWTIEVCDQWASDNGFIFEWSVNFDQSLFPSIETFTPQIIDWTWDNNPSIFYTSATNDSIIASPQNAGSASYTFNITDDFGCTYNTFVTIPVLPPTHPDCHACEGELETLVDTSVCAGEFLLLNGEVPVSLGNQSVTFESYDNIPFDNDVYPNIAPYESPITINNLNPATLNSAILQIESVCIDIAHGFDSDIEVYLRSPSGAVLELTSDNGGSGNNYTNTCFTPDAALPITAGTPPFTGEFQPEGIWNILNGSPLNGDWTLLVSDDQNGGGGTFLGWQITFTNENNITYTWADSPDLSCLDCPDPEVNPTTQTTVYTLETEDSFGCILNDTVEVQLVAALAAPDLNCNSISGTEIEFTWDAIPGASSYEVSLDGGATWIPANGGLSHSIAGLNPGDMVDIQVRAVVSSASGCSALVADGSCVALDCGIQTDTVATTAPSCFNTTDGTITMTTSGGTNALTFYSLDGAATVSSVNNPTTIDQVSAGIHTVVVYDIAGCSDSITFEILAPPAVTATIVVDEIDCSGGIDGSATATGSGGVGNLNYSWNTVPVTTTPTLSNVIAGTYEVTIADANGCSIIEEVIIPDGNPLSVMMSGFPASCNQENSGSATATPAGGTGTYSYLWSNNQITATANNLLAGIYEVTVTDSNGCEVIDNITITEPDAIVLDFTTTSVACFGESSGSATAVLTNAVEPVTYVWSNGNGTISNNNITAGNYCLTITDANNCMAINCVDITEPVAMILTGASTPTLCSDGTEGTATVTVSGGEMPYSYLWPDGQITATAINLASGDQIVTVTDNSTCEQTITITVDAASAIDLQIVSTPTACFNTNDGTATVTASGGMGNTFAYQWDANASLQTSANAIDLLPGEYCVTVTDNNNCTANTCVTVDAPPAIEIMNSFQTAITCFGENDGQAEVTVSGGAGTNYTYLWDDAVAQSTNPATALTVGTYTVLVTDANGCTIEESITVDEPAELIASINSTDVACFGENTGSAVATETGGTGPYDYAWSNGQNSATAINLLAGQQQVTITDANGCTATAMVMIIEPNTALTLDGQQTFVGCFGESQSTASAIAMGGTSGYNYTWNNGNTTADAFALATGNAEVTVTDANGCTATETVVVAELPEVTVEIIDVEPTCFGQATGLLGAVADGGLGAGNPDNYTYIWSTGTVNDTITNALGDVEYFVTVTDAQGCTVVDSKLLQQPGAMTFLLEPTDVSCNGSGDGMVSVTNISGGTFPFNFEWDAAAANQTTETATDLLAGTYAVTVIDANGCDAENLAAIEEPEPVTLTFQSEDNACSGLAVGTASVQATGGVGNYSYIWSNGETTARIEDLETGSVTVTVTDANDCPVEQEIFISQPEALIGSVSSEPVTCFGDRDGRVRMEVIGGTAPYRYQFDDGDLNGTTNLVGIAAGTYSVLAQDVNGCEWESEVTVGTPPQISVFAGEDATITLGDEIQLQPTQENAVGDFQISWSAPYSGTLLCADSTEICTTPVSITQNTITYEVYLVDENGCETTDQITITVAKNRDIFVPTAFTPNGDNMNSTLLVHGADDITVDLFRVYDRWGALIYETRDFPVNDGVTGWDGTFRGKEVNPGLYVWYIEASYIDGHSQTFKGQTTLIK